MNTGVQVGYETSGLSFNYFNITHEKSKIHGAVQQVNSSAVVFISLDQPIIICH